MARFGNLFYFVILPAATIVFGVVGVRHQSAKAKLENSEEAKVAALTPRQYMDEYVHVHFELDLDGSGTVFLKGTISNKGPRTLDKVIVKFSPTSKRKTPPPASVHLGPIQALTEKNVYREIERQPNTYYVHYFWSISKVTLAS